MGRDSVNVNCETVHILEMSHTFNQTTHGKYNTPVQNTGQMDLTVNNSRRSGDNISIGGSVGTIGSVGGQNIQNKFSSGKAVKNPTTKEVEKSSEQSREKFGSSQLTGNLPDKFPAPPGATATPSSQGSAPT